MDLHVLVGVSRRRRDVLVESSRTDVAPHEDEVRLEVVERLRSAFKA